MLDSGERTYTAAELAAAVNRELGTSLTARTIYFYRAKGVLSPLEMIGSQPKFTDRHRLELRAALAMQSTMDRPSLEQIGERLQSLNPEQIEELAAVKPLASNEVLCRASSLRETAPQAVPYRRALFSMQAPAGGPAMPRATPRLRRVEINPDVWLQLSVDLPPTFVAGLVELVERYYEDFREEQGQC